MFVPGTVHGTSPSSICVLQNTLAHHKMSLSKLFITYKLQKFKQHYICKSARIYFLSLFGGNVIAFFPQGSYWLKLQGLCLSQICKNFEYQNKNLGCTPLVVNTNFKIVPNENQIIVYLLKSNVCTRDCLCDLSEVHMCTMKYISVS
jgi:hypothetical protein